jgi:hypothetical protein
MPFGTFQQGGASRIKVGTVTPPATLVGGLQSANYAGQRQTQTDDFYNGQPSDTSVGKASRRWQLQGKASTGDDGLIVLKTAFDDDTGPILYASGSFEGTNGEILPCRVANFETGWPNPNQKSTYSVTMEQAGDPVDAAGGGLYDAAA